VRVLTFLLGQRPGYFAHHKTIAEAIETNLTSLRAALAELRAEGLLTWELIPPHHQLPTGKYTRTNVNQYFINAEALLGVLGVDANGTPSQSATPTPQESDASSGTDPKFEQHSPRPLGVCCGTSPNHAPSEAEGFPKFLNANRARADPPDATAGRSATPVREQTAPPELDAVLDDWRASRLGDADDRSKQALRNRHAEGATVDQLRAAAQDDWLRQGHAKCAFAVVFATVDSVARFADVGREQTRRTAAIARQRAEERRAQRDLENEARCPEKCPENAALAEAALRRVLALAASHKVCQAKP
jgi:hypothetical protein